ncbi:unnamed protein product [Chrysodeixis includens]|uniref:Uncharacterized protein n=1 Tax=Chrysodeixis includens TaxID=689277 RepID=A0A9N8KSA2_CHRIL|nr:unnamed protein product [Chrysodeixis includens]
MLSTKSKTTTYLLELFECQGRGNSHEHPAAPAVSHKPPVLPATAASVTMTPASYGHIIVHKRVRIHRCTLCSFTLIVRWDDNPTRPKRDKAQDPHFYVPSETQKL